MNHRKAKTQKERLAERRRNLVNAAAGLFLSLGYERTTLGQIIEKAGGSKATFYREFGDKAGLFKTVVIELCEAMFEPIKSPSAETNDHQKVLREIGSSFLKLTWGDDVQALSRIVYAEGMRNPEIADVFFEYGYEEGYRQLSGFLISSSSGVTEEEAMELSRMFFAMIAGDAYDRLLAKATLQRNQRELDKQLELAIEWISWKLTNRE